MNYQLKINENQKTHHHIILEFRFFMLFAPIKKIENRKLPENLKLKTKERSSKKTALSHFSFSNCFKFLHFADIYVFFGEGYIGIFVAHAHTFVAFKSFFQLSMVIFNTFVAFVVEKQAKGQTVSSSVFDDAGTTLAVIGAGCFRAGTFGYIFTIHLFSKKMFRTESLLL
jgi:hypothetical protein